MTNDELEKKIYEVKKMGLEKVIAHQKIRSLIIQNNKEKYKKLVEDMHERTLNNIRHLARCNKIPFSEKNFVAFTGHSRTLSEYRLFMSKEEMSLYIPMLASLMYNFPLEMIIFHNLEIYDEKNIQENFPNSFRDYFSETSFG